MYAANNQNVLVVDDDRDVCSTLKEVLEIQGYGVTTAFDGAEALTQLRAGLRPLVVLLDLMMPGMNGFEFREEQRNDPELAPVPIIVLSGDGRVPQKAASLGLEWLQKPVSLHSLLAVLERFRRATQERPTARSP
jgi:CheY-like chemotaxis protein